MANPPVCNCRSQEGEGDCEACRAGGLALFVAAFRLVRQRWIEAAAAACGLTGSLLLAAKGEHAAWGWWAFLASNAGWVAFAWIRGHWFMLLQQVGFTATSLWGIWNWMVIHG